MQTGFLSEMGSSGVGGRKLQATTYLGANGAAVGSKGMAETGPAIVRKSTVGDLWRLSRRRSQRCRLGPTEFSPAFLDLNPKPPATSTQIPPTLLIVS